MRVKLTSKGQRGPVVSIHEPTGPALYSCDNASHCQQIQNTLARTTLLKSLDLQGTGVPLMYGFTVIVLSVLSCLALNLGVAKRLS